AGWHERIASAAGYWHPVAKVERSMRLKKLKTAQEKTAGLRSEKRTLGTARDSLLAKQSDLTAPITDAQFQVDQTSQQLLGANAALPGIEDNFNRTVADATADRAARATVSGLQQQTRDTHLQAQAIEESNKIQAAADKRLLEAIKEQGRLHKLTDDRLEELARRQH